MSFNGIWEPTKLLQCAYPITNSPTWYFLIWQFVFPLSFSSSRVRATLSFVDFVLWDKSCWKETFLFIFSCLSFVFKCQYHAIPFLGWCLVSCLVVPNTYIIILNAQKVNQKSFLFFVFSLLSVGKVFSLATLPYSHDEYESLLSHTGSDQYLSASLKLL